MPRCLQIVTLLQTPQRKLILRLVAVRESFDSKQEFMLHLKRNIHLDRQWVSSPPLPLSSTFVAAHSEGRQWARRRLRLRCVGSQMKKRTTEAVEKRDKKQAAQKAQEASAQAKREKERKFVRRHGYKPDVFPDLPKFRMPKVRRREPMNVYQYIYVCI